MRENIIISLLLVLILITILGYSTVWHNKKTKAVLAYESRKVQQTVTPIPTMTPSSSPPNTPTPKPTKKPTNTPILTKSPVPSPTVLPQPQYSSEQIYEFYNRFGGQYAVSPDILRHIADCESGFNSQSVNGQYAGLFQFHANTWSRYRTKMGEDPDPAFRLNAEEAVQTAAYILQINEAYIWPNCMP